jgi:site-specific DNA-cytosine methylase
MSKLRLLSICSGIGGADLAAEWTGAIEVVGQVEIEPFCRAVLSKQWPHTKRLHDIKEVQGDEFGAIDLVVAGIPCFAAGTLILTEQGYRDIASLSVGDRVLTHLGRWRPVTAIMQRDHAELRRIKAQGVPEIITTDEHPFFARKQTRFNSRLKGVPFFMRTFGEPEWISAENLSKDHYIAQVLPAESISEYQPAFWWLVGRYLADGWTTTRASRSKELQTGRMPYGVVICCSHAEAAMLYKKIRDAGYHASEVKERTVTKFHIASIQLYHFLAPFGKYAYGKVLPGSILSLDTENAKALLEGYISGDGSRDRINHTWSITTTSKALALSVALLAQRAYGVIASVRRCRVKKQTSIEGRTVQQRDFYIVTIPDRNRSGFIEGSYGWKLVRTSEPCGNGTVYNISVAEDESYLADGAAVHNCQPFSNAGKQRGTADDRYLWPDLFRVVRRCQPSWVVIENVDDFTYLALDLVQADLETEGYTVQALVLPACAVGAPHIRERCFVVAHSNRLRECGPTSNSAHQQCSALEPASVCRWKDRAAHVAHPSRQRPSPQWNRGNTGPYDATGACGEDVAYPEYGRRQRGSKHEESSDTTLLRGSSTTRISPQSRMGRVFDGVSVRLDRMRWPSLPGERQQEWEPPRTITGRSLARGQRLKALGNAIVPQQIYPIFQGIVAWERG